MKFNIPLVISNLSFFLSEKKKRNIFQYLDLNLNSCKKQNDNLKYMCVCGCVCEMGSFLFSRVGSSQRLNLFFLTDISFTRVNIKLKKTKTKNCFLLFKSNIYQEKYKEMRVFSVKFKCILLLNK